MTGRVALAFSGALLLCGCIPPSPDFPSERSPRLETEMGTVFDERPVWEARPVVANAAPISGGTYTVQAGDTLSGIGERSGAGTEAIARTNGLAPPFAIRLGQRLTIPEGRFHKVAQGETGIAIARAYGVGWAKIVEANELSEPFILKVGQRLVIPAGPKMPDASIEARAAGFKLDIEDILTGGEPAQVDGSAGAQPLPDPKTPLPPSFAVSEPGRFGGSFGWPAAGKVVARYGTQGEGDFNQGVEIATPPNAPVYASSDGVVAFVGNNVANFGGMILIRHGSGWITAYGRAARTIVTRGQSVKRGDVIGTMGTGSTPRLHFEIRQNRAPVDPMTKLPRT
jgi:murein DD-endopeptidase MepM/ murein hydrolase activator NlpD